MPEFLSNISSLMVFLAIAAVGFIFLIVSSVLGDVFDGVGIDSGLDGGADGNSFLDSRVISVFVTSFGGFGAIGIQTGFGIVASSLIGLAGGVVLGGLVSLFARFLQKQQSSSSVGTDKLVGRTAQVIVSGSGRYAGVSGLTQSLGATHVPQGVGEERVEKLARAKDNLEIKAGVIVRIDDSAGDSLIVSPYTET